MVVTVNKIDGKPAILIPESIARELNLTDGTRLDLSTHAGVMTLRKRVGRARRPLSEIVAEIDPESYRRRNAEFSADGPVGREVF